MAVNWSPPSTIYESRSSLAGTPRLSWAYWAYFQLIICFSRVLAIMYGHPELEDWKHCVKPKQDEERIGEQLRKDFEPFQLPPV